MKEYRLNINKIENEIIPEFSILFSNPRKMKLFKNFIKTQAYVKNKFLDLLYKKEESQNTSLLKRNIESVWSEEIEGQFTYLYYSIFIFPEKAHEIFLSPEVFFNLISEEYLTNNFNLSEKQFKNPGEDAKDKIDKFLKKEDSRAEKLIKLRNIFRKYSSKESFILNLLLQNNLQSLIDISKVDSIFSGKSDYKGFKELIEKGFDGDWSYFFIILKKKILSELSRNYQFYKYYSLFAEGSYWKGGSRREYLDEIQTGKIFDFFNEMIQFPEFLDLICETIISHISPKTDFLLSDEFKTFSKFSIYSNDNNLLGTKIYKNDERFTKMMNIILEHIFTQLSHEEDRNQINSEFIYRVSFYLTPILRMFPLERFDVEMAFSNPKIKKALFYGSVLGSMKNPKQEDLVNYSYYLLNFKFQLNKLDDISKKRFYYKFPEKEIFFEEQEIFGIITNLLRRNSFEINNPSGKAILESMETLLFILYLKKISEGKSLTNLRLKMILNGIRKELYARDMPEKFTKEKISDYLFIDSARDEEVIRLTKKVSDSNKEN